MPSLIKPCPVTFIHVCKGLYCFHLFLSLASIMEIILVPPSRPGLHQCCSVFVAGLWDLQQWHRDKFSAKGNQLTLSIDFGWDLSSLAYYILSFINCFTFPLRKEWFKRRKKNVLIQHHILQWFALWKSHVNQEGWRFFQKKGLCICASAHFECFLLWKMLRLKKNYICVRSIVMIHM